MTRTKSIAQALSKTYKTFGFDGSWLDVMGDPEIYGHWIIYGLEKNGKTWFSLLLGEYLSRFKRTLYISGEEGLSKSFTDALRRANIDYTSRKYKVQEYEPIEDIDARLKGSAPPKIVIIDNVTFYADELNRKIIKQWMIDHKTTLFIWLAHEERNEPDLAIAKHIKKMAKIIGQVKGLQVNIWGRCPGGIINIDEEKAQLYHGTKPLT